MESTKYNNKKIILKEDSSLVLPIAYEINGVELPEFTIENLEVYLEKCIDIIKDIPVDEVTNITLPSIIFAPPAFKDHMQDVLGKEIYSRLVYVSLSSISGIPKEILMADPIHLAMFNQGVVIPLKRTIFATRDYLNNNKISLRDQYDYAMKLLKFVKWATDEFENFMITSGNDGVNIIPIGVEDLTDESK